MQRRSFLGALIAAPLAALGLKAKPKAPTTPDIDVYHHGTRDIVVLPPGYHMSYIRAASPVEPGAVVQSNSDGTVTTWDGKSPFLGWCVGNGPDNTVRVSF